MTSLRKLLSTTILLAGAVLALGCSKDSAAPAASSSAAPAAAKPTGKVTAADCEKLAEHNMDVTLSGMSAPEELRKDPETKKMAEGCDKDFTRARYDCVMKAQTEKAMDACQSVE